MHRPSFSRQSADMTLTFDASCPKIRRCDLQFPSFQGMIVHLPSAAHAAPLALSPRFLNPLDHLQERALVVPVGRAVSLSPARDSLCRSHATAQPSRYRVALPTYAMMEVVAGRSMARGGLGEFLLLCHPETRCYSRRTHERFLWS